MGQFSKETLDKFNAMCAEGVDFGEGPVYDFAKCLMSNGDVYGIEPGEKCEKGRPITGEGPKKKETPAGRMTKLKLAFIKKIGREMTPKELKQAAWIVDNTKAPKK